MAHQVTLTSGISTRSSSKKGSKRTKTQINEDMVSYPGNWQKRKTTLCQQNEHLLKTGEFSDCVFIVGCNEQKRFKCHRLLLGKASSVFGAMMFGPLAEDNNIYVTDVKPTVFEMMLNYIYTGSVELHDYNTTIELCIVADKYMIETLKKVCTEKLCEDLNPVNVFQIHDVAKLLNLKELKQKVLKVMMDRTNEILDSPEFYQASPDQLLMLAAQDSLNINSEAELIKPYLQWAEYEADRKGLPNTTVGLREALGPIFQHLRFLALTDKEFSVIAESTSALSDKEKWVLISQIIKQDFSAIPEGLSNKQEIRVNNSTAIPKFTFTRNVYMSGNACKMSYDTSANSCNNGSSLCCTEFTVNSNVIMVGFTVSTNQRNHANYGYGYHNSDYLQIPLYLDAVVLKNSANDSILTGSVNFKEICESGHQKFNLEKPVLLKKDKIYHLTIISYTFAYMQGKVFQSESVACQNMYTDENFATNGASMISSIVYKKA